MLKARLLGAIGIVAVVGGIAGVLAVQAPTSPTFEVASVKIASQDSRPGLSIQAGGRFVATHIYVRGLLNLAFGQEHPLLRPNQIVDAPGWIDTTYIDIAAKARTEDLPFLPLRPVSASLQLAPLLRSLLADRFKLRAHWETRLGPVYNLAKAANGGALGPDLHSSTTDCDAPDARCGTTLVAGPRARLTARGATMQDVAMALPRGGTDRPVNNVTGLEGRYDFVLQWSGTQDELGATNAGGAPDPFGPYDASLVTAIHEQLGLKLEPATGPVDLLIIEHIERPTPD